MLSCIIVSKKEKYDLLIFNEHLIFAFIFDILTIRKPDKTLSLSTEKHVSINKFQYMKYLHNIHQVTLNTQKANQNKY